MTVNEGDMTPEETEKWLEDNPYESLTVEGPRFSVYYPALPII